MPGDTNWCERIRALKWDYWMRLRLTNQGELHVDESRAGRRKRPRADLGERWAPRW